MIFVFGKFLQLMVVITWLIFVNTCTASSRAIFKLLMIGRTICRRFCNFNILLSVKAWSLNTNEDEVCWSLHGK